MTRKWHISIVILIFAIGFFLPFYKIGTNPPSLDWDEASLGYNAYSILKTGKDEYGSFLPLSIRSFDDYKPAMYVYLAVPSVWLLGLNEFSVRLPSAVMGGVAVIAIYFLTLELLDGWESKKKEYIALVSSFFLSISPWHLQFSRAAFEGNVGLTFLLLGLLFFFKAINKNKYFFPSVISFVFSLYSYHSFRLIIPLLILVLAVLFYKELKEKGKALFFPILILIFLAFPIYLSFIAPGGAGSRLSMVTIFSQVAPTESLKRLVMDKNINDNLGVILHNRRLALGLTVIKGYLDHFNPVFLFLEGDGGLQHHAAGMGMLYLFDLPFIIAGMYFLFKKRSKKIIAFFILFLLAPIPSAITSGTPHAVRAITMSLGFSIFAGAGIVSIVIYILKFKKILISLSFIGSIILLYLLNIVYYFHQYYVDTPIEYGYFWQYGNKEAILFAKKNESKFSKIIMTYKYDQPYIYYLFYNRTDPTWYQKHWDYNGNGQVDRFKRVIGNYEFRNINYQQDKKLPNALLIGTPDEINTEANLQKEIFFPDGKVAYKIVKT